MFQRHSWGGADYATNCGFSGLIARAWKVAPGCLAGIDLLVCASRLRSIRYWLDLWHGNRFLRSDCPSCFGHGHECRHRYSHGFRHRPGRQFCSFGPTFWNLRGSGESERLRGNQEQPNQDKRGRHGPSQFGACCGGVAGDRPGQWHEHDR